MKKAIIFIALFVAHFTGRSQNVTIKGSAEAYANKVVSVWVSNDHISDTQKQLTYSDVDSAGIFLLQFSTKEIQYITLKIEKYITSMYVEPDENYDVKIMAPDSSTYNNPNIEHDVKLSIRLKSKKEINTLTMDYDQRFDDFLSVEYKSFVSRVPLPKIDSFKLAMYGYYSTVSNSYFIGYVVYTIAALEEKTKMSERKLFDNYINGKPILYNHKEYMDFFNSFFKQRLQNFSMSKEGNAMIFQINDRGSYSGAMEVYKRDPFLQNDTLREFALIKGLYESYYNGVFKRTSIVPMLQQIVAESNITEHQRIALNILNSFSKLKAGSTAPFFELPDKTGSTHSLDELRTKKYVYLMFFDVGCTYCLQQMKIIPALKKKYGERITFVSISTDKSNFSLKNFCDKNPKYDWLFLYDNTNGQVKNNYEIKTLPAYFLIDPDGKFVQVPAASPDEDIDRVFFDITKPKAKVHGVGDKKNH
ncbi:MAG: peroxiredoxin family protein [Bacteroidota bacterium]